MLTADIAFIGPTSDIILEDLQTKARMNIVDYEDLSVNSV